MQAIVINTKPNKEGLKPPFSTGEEVTLTVCTCTECKGKTFFVKEYPPQTYAYWRFAFISDIDETTFERNYNKELI